MAQAKQVKVVMKKTDDGSLEPDFELIPTEAVAVAKALWKEHQNALAESSDKIVELEKAVEDGKTELEKAKVADARRTAIVKAAELDGLPVTPDILGIILLKAQPVLTKSENAVLEQVLRAGSEGLKMLFVEKGAGTDGSEALSAVAQLEVKAKEIQKKEGITKEQAFVKATETYPELARAERAERDRAVRSGSGK